MLFHLADHIRSTWTKVKMESAKSLLNPGACGFIKSSDTKNYVANELKLRIQKLEKILQLKKMNFVNFLQIQSGRNYTSKKRNVFSPYLSIRIS